MQQLFKRMLSVLLAVAVLLSLTVTAFAADDGADAALTAADYAAADALFNAAGCIRRRAHTGHLRLSQRAGRGRARLGRDEWRTDQLDDGAGHRLCLFSASGADRGGGGAHG